MNIKFLLASLPMLMTFLAQAAFGAIQVTAPVAVGKGNAFVAQARSDAQVKSFVFSWLGKKREVQAMPTAQGWEARVLLPVPLDAMASQQTVTVTSGAGKAEASVKFQDVKRSVQKLQVDRKYVAPPPEVQERIRKDREKVRKALAQPLAGRMWALPLERPVPGTVSSQFGLKRTFNGQLRGQHRGLDLRGSEGTPILASADGVVALVDDLYYSGNTVYVNHGDGVFTAYLHMSKTNVQPGQNIRRGDVLGYVGATGRVTGPHLHLSVIAQGESVDPLPLLQGQPEGGKHAAQ